MAESVEKSLKEGKKRRLPNVYIQPGVLERSPLPAHREVAEVRVVAERLGQEFEPAFFEWCF